VQDQIKTVAIRSRHDPSKEYKGLLLQAKTKTVFARLRQAEADGVGDTDEADDVRKYASTLRHASS